MTFSIVGRSADGTYIGGAVASKVLAVGSYVLAGTIEGVVATQAYGHGRLKVRGLEMLAQGVSAHEVLERFFADDAKRHMRQAGIVDSAGRAASYTGTDCVPWAGGLSSEGPEGACAIQGNMLTGSAVIEAMVADWRSSAVNVDLARRLVWALSAGQAAGGDIRGQQAAAVLVLSPDKGYGGDSDVVADYRIDNDRRNPIGGLHALLDEHEARFGQTPEDQYLSWNGEVTQEARGLLAKAGFASGDVRGDLLAWMSSENYEQRWRDEGIDPIMLERLRLLTQ